MASFSQEDRSFIMACYTVALCNDDNLNGKTIKTSTIKLYLAAAARLSIPAALMDPTKNRFGQKSEFIQAVLKEHKRWEQMPNRRCPITPKMIYTALQQPPSHPDELHSALNDWFILALFVGPRKLEWCQDASDLKKFATFSKNVDGSPRAFTFKDFSFLGPGNKKLPHAQASYLGNVNAVRICWRFQKNGDNGQTLTYQKNHGSPYRCPVQAAYNICARAIRMGINSDGPVAVYRTGAKLLKARYIDNIVVEKRLRELAAATYDLTESADLQKYTCHSLRVGACVLLHTAQASPDTIQLRLRWRSDSYKMYLRDTVKLAGTHNLAMNTSDPDCPDVAHIHNF